MILLHTTTQNLELEKEEKWYRFSISTWVLYFYVFVRRPTAVSSPDSALNLRYRRYRQRGVPYYFHQSTVNNNNNSCLHIQSSSKSSMKYKPTTTTTSSSILFWKKMFRGTYAKKWFFFAHILCIFFSLSWIRY